MTTVSLKLPSTLNHRLARASRALGVSKSEFLRQALEARLAQAPKLPSAPSLLDRAGDLVGRVRFGPADLSTNPKHLEGYGEDRRR